MSQTSTKDKRLHSLRQQLLGKEAVKSASPQMQSTTTSFAYTTKATPTLKTSSSELTYLKKDLLKILTLATSAIFVQLFLAYSLNHHLIAIPSF